MAERLLIVEDEETLSASLKRVFAREGYLVDAVNSAEAALDLLDEGYFDLIVTDIILPGVDGIELLRKVKERNPDQSIIIMTAYASLETAVEALRAGAYDYVVKPIIHEEIRQIVHNALNQKALQRENVLLKRQIEKQYDFSRIIGESPAMQRIIREVKKIADARSTLLILGETGTGKELIARAIHFNSGRANKPFIPINCSAIPEPLLESELFGHVKGAFTGAVAAKKGLFEEAAGGTVFLDEIGDLSMGLQSKLLRVLEDYHIRPVGGNQSVKIDLRFISATNRDIEGMIREGRFREDLFYRINVVTIKLPPLRERKEDIEPLVRYFVQKYSNDLGKTVKEIEKETLELLRKYYWPGNVRELQNIVERAVLLTEDGVIRKEHLPESICEEETFLQHIIDEKLSIEDYTKAFIQTYQGRYTEQQLADMLGITRKSLWEKRKRWGIGRGQSVSNA
ncbi:MAG: sigma-54 dependent transcriptional regulator [Alphaproteobacteria bacterium]|uniref:Sigma-54 dependent transcriptional regulator n=1 Tax=Candidatus Nitrobium versatile TaxID=2884831 RepID=A0A953J755_9BACT|nr:sigma-54 dependent transcriptional regulator [Candidatus Nitrobium versatile]